MTTPLALSRIAVSPGVRMLESWDELRRLDARADALGCNVSTHLYLKRYTAVAFSTNLRAEALHRGSAIEAIEAALDDYERYVFTADELAQIQRQSV